MRPGGTGAVRVVFDPLGKKGKTVKGITVFSNDSRQPEKRIFVRADVVHWTSARSGARLQRVLFSGRCRRCHADRAAGRTGRELYNGTCGMCHGENGLGREEGRSAPRLKALGAAETRKAIAEGVLGKGMPAYAKRRGGPLDDAQIESLVIYLEGLRLRR